MAKRSTRNKIRFQISAAQADLEKAQVHLTQSAALADGRHPLLDKDLPIIMASLQMVIDALDNFYNAL